MEAKRTYPSEQLLFRLFQIMEHLLHTLGLAVILQFQALQFPVTDSCFIGKSRIFGCRRQLRLWFSVTSFSLAIGRGLFRYGSIILVIMWLFIP